MSRRTIFVFLAAVLLALAGLAGPAAAQSVNDAVADLRQNDVTFEQDAPGLTSNELARLDATAARLSDGNSYFKVVVLAAPVEDFSTPWEFAESIQARLGGQGRVLVFDSERVGIASTLDGDDEVARAEEAAADEANRAQSYAAGVTAAAQVLGVSGSSGGSSGGGSGGSGSADPGGGGSSAWIWVVLLLAGGALVVFLLLRSRKKSTGRAHSTVSLGEGEMKVRHEVDRAGNLILELADRVELAGAPPEAKQLFNQGASEFADLQDDLEQADTHEELEAVYPKIVDAVWKLDSAKALTEGQPAPAKPEPGPLFPSPPAPSAPAGGAPLGPVQAAPPAAASQGYRSSGTSPWLTTAATAALTMLMSRSMAPQREYRSPAPDDSFGSGGGGGGGRRRRGSSSGGGINLSGGSSGRGMGRRR